MTNRMLIADKLEDLTGYIGRCNEIRGNRKAKQNALSAVNDWFDSKVYPKCNNDGRMEEAKDKHNELLQLINRYIPEQTKQQFQIYNLWLPLMNHLYFLFSGCEPDQFTRNPSQYNGDRQQNYIDAKQRLINLVGNTEELQMLFNELETTGKLYLEKFGQMNTLEDKRDNRKQWETLYSKQKELTPAYKQAENNLTNYLMEVSN